MAAKFRLHVVMAEKNLLSIKELSEKSGITRSAVSRIYNNRMRTVQLSTLDKLAQALGCAANDLIESS